MVFLVKMEPNNDLLCKDAAKQSCLLERYSQTMVSLIKIQSNNGVPDKDTVKQWCP